MALGSDTYEDLCNMKWKGGLDLFKEVNIQVVARADMNSKATSEDEGSTALITSPRGVKKKVTLHNIPALTNISSTIVRETIKNKVWFQAAFYVHTDVLQYIKNHSLYQ